MAKGRKKVPDNMKVIRGTFRDDRSNKTGLLPDPETPRSPSWLPADAREHFGILKERLDGYGLASKTHTEMIALAALRLSEIDSLNKVIEDEGMTFMSPKGLVKGHPAVKQRSDALRHLQSLLAEFGLSPASIGKVSAGGKGKEKKQGFGGL